MRLNALAVYQGTLLVGAVVFAFACGSLGTSEPPEPAPDRDVTAPDGTSYGMGTPKPSATPGDPNASPTPAPTPAAAGCDAPLPPAIAQINLKEHIKGPEATTLDSTPLVKGAEYCKQIGFTDGRSLCPVRPEGHPQRAACEQYAVGVAQDTNRPGPTWRLDGHFCTGPSSGCMNHDENQYLLKAYANGKYTACARSGVCGELDFVR